MPIEFEQLFSPVTVGRMRLKSRVMMPPHTSAIGSIYGDERQVAQNIAYLAERAASGVAWVTVPDDCGPP